MDKREAVQIVLDYYNEKLEEGIIEARHYLNCTYANAWTQQCENNNKLRVVIEHLEILKFGEWKHE
jgi:hypothetical protein